MVRVRQSTIIEAPLADVWRILRDFNGHDRWHPAVATSAIEGGAPIDAIGSVRRFRLSDGSELREQLLSLSDRNCSLTYCILEAPLPLMGYVAAIRLKAVTDGDRTFWEWRSEFEPPSSRRDELVNLVTKDIYQSGFAAIRNLFGRSSVRATPDRPAAPALRIVEPPARAPATGATTRVRAIVVDRYGGPEQLRLAEVALPPPAPVEVRVRHTAIVVNFIDVYCRTGYFDLLQPPGVPGMEAAGIIELLGADVRGFSVGERVAYACPPVGAYCERRNMSPEFLVRLSDDISDEIAAAALLKGVTASFLLHDVHPVKPGELVLVHAAAGGVGQILTQWARRLGATIIGVVSNDEKGRLVERLGAHHVVVSSRESFLAATMRITNGRGVDVVFDAVGADTFSDSLSALAVRGHLVSFGQASGAVGEWDIGRLAGKSISISRPNYAHFTDTQEKLSSHVVRFFSAMRQGFVSVAAPRRYDLARAAEAHRDIESRRTTGSLILTP
jgi:NADPH:quinone reductase-like Zn-dependent oxidoreductase